MITPVALAGHSIGPLQPCFVIAEVGVNHNGDMDVAHTLIDQARQAGADAVKFQSFFPEDLVTAQVPKAGYQAETTGAGEGQLDMLRRLALSAEQQGMLKAHCDRAGILYLCTPYELRSAEMLDAMGVAGFKVGSTDTVNVPFLRHLARLGRPVILSTGTCTLEEVAVGVGALNDGGAGDRTVLMHCVSQYPAPPDQVNLRAMATMESTFQVPVGFSDHTPGVGVAPWAAAAGACCIEKHYTLDKALPGPDHRASLDTRELAETVRQIRAVEAALGDGVKRPAPCEAANTRIIRRSLVAARAIAAGQVIDADDLTAKRPATGLAPSEFDRVVGRRAARAIAEGEILTTQSVDWDAD